MTLRSAPQQMRPRVKKPETKTFHKGHRPPALMPEQTGKWEWSRGDEAGTFWRLTKVRTIAISSHDSCVNLQAYRESQDHAKSATVGDSSDTPGTPERATG